MAKPYMEKAERFCMEQVKARWFCEKEHGKGAEQCMDVLLDEKHCLARRLCAKQTVSWMEACYESAERPSDATRMTSGPACSKANRSLTYCLHPYVMATRGAPQQR
mmetsp:Transcript_10628/g.32666  ORF Transcript_10628/g.32666 Transcript_10628/m.32666 type:complete len:106 (+) Transcript_10628:2-319(+)